MVVCAELYVLVKVVVAAFAGLTAPELCCHKYVGGPETLHPALGIGVPAVDVAVKVAVAVKGDVLLSGTVTEVIVLLAASFVVTVTPLTLPAP